MAAGDLALNILIRADSASASSVIENMGKSITMLAEHPMAAVGIAAAAATAGVVAFGVESVKAAGDFQQMTTVLVTSAGESASQLDMVRQGILNMAVATGTSTEQLAHGMYMIESAGFHGAAGLNVLQAAAMGAKAENADLYVVGNALTTMLTDYHMSADQATQAMNGLIATVASGKTNLQNLASAMGSVLPLASSLHVSFPQIAGAIATMTNAGMSAQRSSMNLANALRSLAAPGTTAQKAMKAVGLSAQDVSNTLTHQGLQQAFAMVEEHVGTKFPAGSAQWTAAMKSIMGGATGLNVALMLGGKNMAGYEDRIKSITAAMSPTQKAIMGWSETQSNFNFKLDQAKQAVNVLMIVVGTALLPVIGRIVDAITPIITAFTNWIGTINAASPMLQNVTGMLGIMAGNWRDFGAQIQSILGGPFKEFGATMGQLLPGFISQFLRALNLAQLAFQDVALAAATIVVPAFKVLGQIFQSQQGVIENVLNALEGQFLPALHNLVAAIAPIIAAILQWVASSGILPVIFSVLGFTLNIVIQAASFLINIIAGLISFFTQTQVGVALLVGILAALGTVLLAIAIASIPAMISAIGGVLVGFGAWIAGAIAVGIANIIAFWPIILIILAIVAAVAIVVLVVRNWGTIAHWLQGVWGAFSSWFMGAMHAVGSFFVGVWTWIQSATTAVWHFIVNAVKIGAQLLLAVILGPFIAIGALFVWLYQHNTYFQKLIDAIVGFIKPGVAWLQNAWQTVIGWIVHAWQTLVAYATVYWEFLVVTIRIKILQAEMWIQSVWNRVTGFLGGIWSTIVTGVSIMWGKISGFFSSAWNTYIAGPLGGLWNSFKGWLSGWGPAALQAGQNFINMLVSGITSGAGAIWNAVSGIAKNIWSALGFHSPPEAGPAKDSDTWMPNLIKMMVTGLHAGVPQMHAAVSLLATPIASLGNSQGFAAKAGNSFAVRSNSTIHVHVHPAESKIYLDKREVGNAVMEYAAKEARTQGNVKR